MNKNKTRVERTLVIGGTRNRSINDGHDHKQKAVIRRRPPWVLSPAGEWLQVCGTVRFEAERLVSHYGSLFFFGFALFRFCVPDLLCCVCVCFFLSLVSFNYHC